MTPDPGFLRPCMLPTCVVASRTQHASESMAWPQTPLLSFTALSIPLGSGARLVSGKGGEWEGEAR